MNQCFNVILGISEENFTKLIQHAQIPSEDRPMITNLSMIGLNVVVDVSHAAYEISSFEKCSSVITMLTIAKE